MGGFFISAHLWNSYIKGDPMKKIRAIFIFMLFVFSFTLYSIPASAAVKNITEGKSIQLKIKNKIVNANWISSDTEILKVTKSGKVTALKEGTAKVNGNYNKKKYSISFNIIKKAEPKPQENDNNQQTDSGNIADYNINDFVAKIKIGWNLGNTLDANNLTWISNLTPENAEVGWLDGNLNNATKVETFQKIKALGFNAVRIPVSWNKFMDKYGNISQEWMQYVKKIVDYAYNEGLYIILNTHHDDEIFNLYNESFDNTKKVFKRAWEQISETFKDYDEKLIFESLNEPRATKDPNIEWNGGTSETRENINILNSMFVEIIRKSGGNNKLRALLIPTYAASTNDISLNSIIIPKDDKIIVSVHLYSPWTFADASFDRSTWSAENSTDTYDITSPLDKLYEKFIKNNIPVIIGEMGCMDKNNTESREAWAEFVVKYAKERSIPCFWWDNGNTGEFAIINRATLNTVFQKVVNGLMSGLK